MSDADDYPGENIDREILEAERALEAENETLRAQRDALKEALESLVDEADKARECLLSESLVGRFRYAARTRIAIDQARAALEPKMGTHDPKMGAMATNPDNNPGKVSQSEQTIGSSGVLPTTCWCGKELIVCNGMPDFPGDDITKPGYIGTCWYECPVHGINYVFQDEQRGAE